MQNTKLKDSRTIRKYSESFKFKVLRELELGKSTKNELVRKYGISPGTLYFWIKKYHRDDLLNPRVIIEMPKERDKKKALELENKQLKEALIQLQLKHLKSEADLECAIEELGFSRKEAFKKKLKANPSKKQ